MARRLWNHNIHYHAIVLGSVSPRCRRALDVGCGQGLLTQRLARHCDEVIGVDIDPTAIGRARAAVGSSERITFVEGDVMTYPLAPCSFDLISVVAALHHLPLEAALVRFRDLLSPAGTLVVVGLYRAQTLTDYAVSAAAFPTSGMLRWLYGHTEVAAPAQDPKETLHHIRTTCGALLPGAVCRRHLLFRYSLIWRKP
jgi:2-polyprenyl-3-methyl-5-hydroxy-6-metoxy-1,4-benzoquinol methylase